MWTLSYTTPQKIGVVLYGLAAGVGATVLPSAALFLVGLAFSLMGNAGWIHLGEYQPWLPLAGLEYGFFLGIIIGAVVCWKVCRSRLRNSLSEQA